MESHAQPGTIQVTERTFERLHQRYELKPRGAIDVKGKGSMTTYLLVGRQNDQDRSADPSPDQHHPDESRRSIR